MHESILGTVERIRRLKVQGARNVAIASLKAVEEAARRTKLAPRKKKQTLMEALELYEQALVRGKEEARSKVDELKRRLKI